MKTKMNISELRTACTRNKDKSNNPGTLYPHLFQYCIHFLNRVVFMFQFNLRANKNNKKQKDERWSTLTEKGLEWLKEEEASSPPGVAVMRSDHQGRTSGLHAISFWAYGRVDVAQRDSPKMAFATQHYEHHVTSVGPNGDNMAARGLSMVRSLVGRMREGAGGESLS